MPDSYAEYYGAVFPPEDDIIEEGDSLPVDSFASYFGAFFPTEFDAREPFVDLIVVADSVHGHTATSPWIAVPALPDDATHAHTAGEPTLTVQLSVDDTEHAHTVSIPAITVQLATADTTHAHTASEPTVQSAIAVNNSTHAHIATVPPVGNQIVPDNSFHGHNASEPTVQPHVITDDAAHAHTATEPTVQPAVVVDDAAHAHTASQPTLQVSVAVDSTQHAHAASQPTLTVAQTITMYSYTNSLMNHDAGLGNEHTDSNNWLRRINDLAFVSGMEFSYGYTGSPPSNAQGGEDINPPLAIGPGWTGTDAVEDLVLGHDNFQFVEQAPDQPTPILGGSNYVQLGSNTIDAWELNAGNVNRYWVFTGLRDAGSYWEPATATPQQIANWMADARGTYASYAAQYASDVAAAYPGMDVQHMDCSLPWMDLVENGPAPVQTIEYTVWFEDAAPHGFADYYVVQAAAMHIYLYDEQPAAPPFVPPGIDSRITDNWADITQHLWDFIKGSRILVDYTSHAHTASEPTVQSAIVADGAAHSHTASEPTVQPSVVVDDSAHAHTASEPTLGFVVAVDDTTHAHTAAEPTVQSSVVVDNTAHAHTAAEPTVQSSVVVDNTAHAHTAGEPTVQPTVVVDNAAHAHTAGEPTVQPAVVVDDAAHAHTAGEPTVTAPTVPDPFTVGDWSLADAASGGTLTVTITNLPADGGSVISDIEYRVDAGTWTSSGTATTGSFGITGLTNDVQVDVELRAVNAVGPGPAGDTKSATPTGGAPAFDIVRFGNAGGGEPYADTLQLATNSFTIELEGRLIDWTTANQPLLDLTDTGIGQQVWYHDPVTPRFWFYGEGAGAGFAQIQYGSIGWGPTTDLTIRFSCVTNALTMTVDDGSQTVTLDTQNFSDITTVITQQWLFNLWAGAQGAVADVETLAVNRTIGNYTFPDNERFRGTVAQWNALDGTGGDVCRVVGTVAAAP